jgi:ComF family protein
MCESTGTGGRESEPELKKRKQSEKTKRDGSCTKTWRAAGHFLLRLLYPPVCPLCDQLLPLSVSEKKQKRCCDRCQERLPWVTGAKCLKCGKVLPEETQEYCSDCRSVHHFFDRGTAAFTYGGAIRRSVYRMKFENRRDYLPFYGEAMYQALLPYLPYWQPDLIVPVPMHPKKKRKRGYNQSQLLAQEVSARSGIPLCTDLLKCVRQTREQKTLSRKERLENLKGSYVSTGRLRPGSRVLLVDDVYTTGSTMDELSRVLKNSGAGQVYFVVLCIGKGKNTVCTAEKLCYTQRDEKERRKRNERDSCMAEKLSDPVYEADLIDHSNECSGNTHFSFPGI